MTNAETGSYGATDANRVRKRRLLAMATFFIASIAFVNPGLAVDAEDGRQKPCNPLMDAEVSAENLDIIETTLENALAMLSEGDEAGLKLALASARSLFARS